MKACCEGCVYAVPLQDAERTLLVCVDRPGTAGQLSIVPPCGLCRRFRKRREKILRLEPPEPPSDDIRYIPLTKGLFAIVDAADYERVSRHTWCARGSGRRAYACSSINGRQVFLHRFLMNPPTGMVVDHIDGNCLNNRRCNLRICTTQQNIWNSRPKGKSSQYKGVCRDRGRRRWVVYVQHNGHNWYMGRFEHEIDAARAYDRKAHEVFGEYAWLNFPEEYGMAPRDRTDRQKESVSEPPSATVRGRADRSEIPDPRLPREGGSREDGGIQRTDRRSENVSRAGIHLDREVPNRVKWFDSGTAWPGRERGVTFAVSSVRWEGPDGGFRNIRLQT